MAVEVILPKVDMDMETGQISRWYAKDGDTVTKGQLLFEIETDKAAMEVDSPASGILGDVSAQEGAVVPVGQAVAWIYAEGEERKPAAAAASVAPAPVAAEPVKDIPASKPVPQAEVVASSLATASEAAGVRATPLARRLARQAGLDLATVTGSGPKGRIQKQDIEASLAKVPSSVAVAAPVAKSAPRAPVVAGEAELNVVWLRPGSDASALPIVLIHGFGADLNSWRLLLAGASLPNPVLAIDLPGHGASPRFIPENLDAIAEQVESSLVASGVQSFILVGHSFGAAVASLVSARGNLDVRALTLISSAGLGPNINGAFLDGFVRAQSEASLMPWLKALVADEALLSKPFVNATLAQAQDVDLRAAQKTVADRFFADGTQTFSVRSQLATLNIPVRLIFGAEDQIIPVRHAFGLPGEIGVHVFSHCGHMPQLEQRGPVLKIIEDLAKAAR